MCFMVCLHVLVLSVMLVWLQVEPQQAVDPAAQGPSAPEKGFVPEEERRDGCR